MAVSDRTRADVVAHLSEAGREANVRRGQAEGIRAAIADDTKADSAVKRVCGLLLRHLANDDGGTGWEGSSSLRKRLASRDREWFDPALERLISTGQVEAQRTDQDSRGIEGIRCRLSPGRS